MKRHALFVGVDQYADPTIQDLRCAVNDATELAGFFKHGAKFDRAEALANPRNCDAVIDRVRDMLEGLGAGDEFPFFFAGHGVKTRDGHRLVCAGDQLAAVKHAWAGLPLERLKFETAGDFNRLFLLDACRTDVLATNRGVAGAMEAGTRDLILATANSAEAESGTLTIICSCDDGECAGELLSLRHGLFSMAMLNLLEEEKSLGRRVLVTDDFVYGRLPDRMRALAEQSDMVFNQKPQKSGPAILLLDGSATASPPHVAAPPVIPASPIAPAFSALVVCPICGKKNRSEDTFKCRECGRDNICLRHHDEETFLCGDCAAKAHEGEVRKAAQQKVPEEAERKPDGQYTENVGGVTWNFNVKKGLVFLGEGRLAITPKPKGAVVIPDSLGGCPVIGIGSNAFEDCEKLTSVSIPKSVKTIGKESFKCSGLTSVEIPEGVESIGIDAFHLCESLVSISVAKGNENYMDMSGVVFSKDGTKLIVYPAGRKGPFSIPNGVTGIPGNTFWKCCGLSAVTIPKSVVGIGEAAFRDCTGLSSITMQEGLTRIRSYAFLGCTGLTSVAIPSTVTSVGEWAFRGCTGLSFWTRIRLKARFGESIF